MENPMNLDLSAVEKLRDLIAEENNPNLKLRVFIQGGGCSGMSYGFTFDEEKNEDDFDFSYDEIQVLVDSMSMEYLRGANIRYEESAMGSSFVIDNPNAQTTCGCGSSFNPY
jgi:iron-sulfur cluster insertion protein